VAATAATFSKVDDGGIDAVIFKITQVCDGLLNMSETLKSALIDSLKVNESEKGNGGNTHDQRQRLPSEMRKRTNSSAQQSKAPPTAEEVSKAKVKKVLREAERKTIAFDIDMGTAPMMNKVNMSKKVTIDLHDRAKKGEHDWSFDSAAAIVDDILSCAQLEFLGAGTKRFQNTRNKDDIRNNKMCTVPVRFDFKTKEQRINAETNLRKICKVRTSVPYPKRLRKMLNDLIQEGKKAMPQRFIMTKVDIENLRISAHARGENGWVDLQLTKNIPMDLLDYRETVVSEVEVFDDASEDISLS